MNRRNFIRTTVVSALAARIPWLSAAEAKSTLWPIGFFNRAWTNWTYDEALDSIAAAGYKLTGLLSGHRGEVFTASSATPQYLDGLKKRIAQRGLAVNVNAIHLRPDA